MFDLNENNAEYDISVITVEVPSNANLSLGLDFMKKKGKLMAVGLDRRFRFSWKSFQNKITILQAEKKQRLQYE